MTRLDQAPEIVELAQDLGVDSVGPVDGILDYCRRRIDGWVADVGGVGGIDQLESLVAQRLQMAFEEIASDEDFDRLMEEFARKRKEFVFGAMRSKFDDRENNTFGALVQLRNVTANDPVRFIAVIDCRGSKLARRFFTRWHEIAHRLTTHGDMPEPVYRSEHDPIEQLMDQIAGHIGFYGPLFEPAFRQANKGCRHLKFSTVQTVISSSFPTASFQATLFACTRQLSTPVVYLEAAISHKKEVKRRMADKRPRLFDNDEPPPPGELRAVKVIANSVAQEQGIFIPENMRVPADSVIHRLFSSDSIVDGDAEEDLSWWESQGRNLENRAVVVEARKVADRVIAILQPAEPVRVTRNRQQSKPMFSESR